MQKTFILTVKTEDGKCLIRGRTMLGLQYLSYVLLPLCHVFWSVSKVSRKLRTRRGRGIIQSVLDFLLRIPS